MARYRSKPFEVEASQWFAPGDHPAVIAAPQPAVEGRQGWVAVEPGDWIIAEADGSGHYPCKPDVFAAKYEAVTEEVG